MAKNGSTKTIRLKTPEAEAFAANTLVGENPAKVIRLIGD